jgi:hypothetical protein
MQYRTLPGTAQPGFDFTPKTGIRTVAPGETAKRLTVGGRSTDSAVEIDKAFAAGFSDPAGGRWPAMPRPCAKRPSSSTTMAPTSRGRSSCRRPC